MKKIIAKIRESFKRFIFNQFMKYSPSWIENPVIIEFSKSVVAKHYGEKFFPISEVHVKKGDARYTLLFSANNLKFNLGRHHPHEVIEPTKCELIES